MRRYLFAKTGGRHGWVGDLADAAGLPRQTLSAAMGPKSSPDLSTITLIAEAVGVRPFEIVAAMDGDVPVALNDPRVREAMRDEMDRLLDARLGPRRDTDGRAGAA